jgi:uncharacterized Fe-S cluster-containing radical SAM superfamily protein
MPLSIFGRGINVSVWEWFRDTQAGRRQNYVISNAEIIVRLSQLDKKRHTQDTKLSSVEHD